ncbi:amidohydrolase [Steroidobacter flavus]|uniref:Amidohydrolase n=1 Tax=Steroidobacter flavus TaxID=1842136 RepID=A0ABV8T3J2_9GAMM
MKLHKKFTAGLLACVSLSQFWSGAAGADAPAGSPVDAAVVKVTPKVVAWRRDIHQHPELSNREVRTSKLVADHLRSLGIEVTTGVAHTGVVGILRGGQPGRVVALRADMDALPVTEQTDVPFASKVRGKFNGQDVGVMHACGHDAHTAMLMGAAEVLAGMRKDLHGTVKFIFQPAEEGPPTGERGGAALMVEEGVLGAPVQPSAIFGIHVWPGEPGTISYRPRGQMAAADSLTIVVKGVQTHGAQPWHGVDPVIVSAQIMTALQVIPSRQLNITSAPAVVTIGSIHGGVRGNIVPDQVEMKGTIRTFEPEMREDFLKRIRRTAEMVAQSSGATAEVTVEPYAPVTYNDPQLTNQLLPSLRRAAGDDKVRDMLPVMGSEDFSHYTRVVPGLYVFLGINKEGVPTGQAAENHSPQFYVNEDALPVGVRALTFVALDYLNEPRS